MMKKTTANSQKSGYKFASWLNKEEKDYFAEKLDYFLTHQDSGYMHYCISFLSTKKQQEAYLEKRKKYMTENVKFEQLKLC